jgi:rhodanese-related sulfurtransferase
MPFCTKSVKPLRSKLIATVILLSFATPALSQLLPDASIASAKEQSGELTLTATKALFDSHSACFVDARSEYAYYVSHIKGAISISESRFDEQFPDFRQKKSLETPIVVYCIGPNCSKAKHIAKKLVKNGYTNVRVFSGGLIEWSQAGFPMEG